MLPGVLIATDLVLLLLASILIVRIRRQLNRTKEVYSDFWIGLEDAVAQQIGPIAARLIVGEPRLWFAIFTWVSGRSRREVRGFHYAGLSNLGPVFAVVLGLIVVEGIGGGLLARLAPWPWLSPTLIVVLAYAAVWIIGLYASLRAFPHLVTERGVLVRYGVLGEAWIPWRELDQVVEERRPSPGGMDGLSTREGVATFGVGGRTMLTIRRTSPGIVKGFLRETAAIQEIRIAVEDPDAFQVAIQRGHRASGRLASGST